MISWYHYIIHRHSQRLWCTRISFKSGLCVAEYEEGSGGGRFGYGNSNYGNRIIPTRSPYDQQYNGWQNRKNYVRPLQRQQNYVKGMYFVISKNPYQLP